MFDVFLLFFLVHFRIGLLSWNVLDSHVDLEEELRTMTQHAPDGEAARHGKFCILLLKHRPSIAKWNGLR